MTTSIDWNDGYDDAKDEPQRPRGGLWRRLWRTRSRTVAPDATCRPVSVLGADGEPVHATVLGDAMDPADVPDELVRAALKAYCVHCSLTVGHRPYTDHEEEARTILAAALPLHAQQVRAEHQQLRPEYGIRADWISTRSSEGPVAETLGDALRALDEFDAQHGDRLVKRTLIQRPVGNWEDVSTDG